MSLMLRDGTVEDRAGHGDPTADAGDEEPVPSMLPTTVPATGAASLPRSSTLRRSAACPA